jgi:hypothetical protein
MALALEVYKTQSTDGLYSLFSLKDENIQYQIFFNLKFTSGEATIWISLKT